MKKPSSEIVGLKTVEIPASLYAEIKNFVASMRNIVQHDMSFTGIAAESEELEKKMDEARNRKVTRG